MRTELGRRTTVHRAWAPIVAGALVLAITATAIAATVETQSSHLSVTDIERIGDISLGVPPTNAAVSRDQARDIVETMYSPSRAGVKVDEYLETATILGTFGSDVETRDRSVWIVRLSGFEVQGGGRVQEDGKRLSGVLYHFAYVVIDANTTEFLLTEWLP